MAIGGQMKKLTKKAKIIILVAVLVFATVGIAFGAVAGSDKIYRGVSVAGIDLGGMSQEEASEILSQREFFGDIPSFECDGRVFDVSPDVFSLSCDSEATVKTAYNAGRGGNAFSRVKNAIVLMANGCEIPMEVKYDAEALNIALDAHIGDMRTPTVGSQFRVDGDKLYILNGNKGIDVNFDKLENEFAKIADGSRENILVSVEPVEPEPVSVKELRAQFCREKQDADYKIENKRITYTESVDGIDFDDGEVEKILSENVNNIKEYSIPLKIDKAERTVETLNEELFGDCLGTYTSRYNPGEVGRTKNVTLAANKINNVVLQKGDVFSYNEIVGERTVARGFTGAKVYAGGNVVDGLGGGICHVSSVLYNAVLYADLQIVSRSCHSLPVTYVPLGRDATVAYGSIDFKFKNQYDTPVKISSSIGGGVLTVSVYGKKNGDKKVELSTERLRTIPYSVIEEEDATLAVGATKVKQAGSDGAVVNTYKKVIENGKVISNKMIHTSYYNPINKIVLVHPAEEVPEVPVPDVPVTETPVPEAPVSEADALETSENFPSA